MTVTGDVLLVGSVPLASAEEVMTTCADALGPDAIALPDGETGDRSIWIVYQAYRVFHEHPQLETLQRPAPIDGVDQWQPAGLPDLWNFKIRDNVDELRFDDLKYASVASSSYQVFRRLRDAGLIPADIRFQVCLPTPESILVFFRDPDQLARIIPAYTDAMEREVQKVVEEIPAEDLLIQWDVCSELLDIEGTFPWTQRGDPGPLQRYTRAVQRLSSSIPEQVQVGYHLCYADLGHQHMKEPQDLGLVVRMANDTIANSQRRVDYFHVPVPRNRDDDEYFAPLQDLDVGDAKMFLGLVHHTDGADGTGTRIKTAKRHLKTFGIATECGFGRRPANQVVELLQIHKAVLPQVAS